MEEVTNYDSTADTLTHIRKVQEYLGHCATELIRRGMVHDNSKLVEPEKSAFDIATPKLKNLRYGSDEYKQSLQDLKPALDHHYANNDHHPEFESNGINGMNLFSVLEMLMDWKAAGERNKDGNIFKSIKINKERFGISEQLTEILRNTAAICFPEETNKA